MRLDLEVVMEASRERGRIAGLLEVAEAVARLVRDSRTHGFLGDYTNAMEDVVVELKRLLEKPSETPADERGGGEGLKARSTPQPREGEEEIA